MKVVDFLKQNRDKSNVLFSVKGESRCFKSYEDIKLKGDLRK